MIGRQCVSRFRLPRLPAEEKTTVLAILATLASITLFLGQSHAVATSEAAERDLYTVCTALNNIAPQARKEKHIVAACAHEEWFARFEQAADKQSHDYS